jgi:uncharacterized protein YecE (DUF72 family)
VFERCKPVFMDQLQSSTNADKLSDLRLHGGSEGGSSPRQALLAHARQIEHYLAGSLDVFVSFNNEAHGAAVHYAADLRQYLQGPAVVGQPGAGDKSTRGGCVCGEECRRQCWGVPSPTGHRVAR